ncbi:MAG: class I SAM-dependent methyltransferase [Dehalococcoidia bacterium]|nr:class I SAM-dependent methyltransferase [Dehalococcoidia bacterium]
MNEDWRCGQIDYVSDMAWIRVPAASFDHLFCAEVLEHVRESIVAVKEFNRILKLGGYLFLSAPLGAGLHQQPYHYHGGFTPHFYRKFLPEYGFGTLKMAPNGGSFRHSLQEVNRAWGIIQSHRNYRRRHPMWWVLRLAFSHFIPIWFSRLDDEIFIEEFTVGYHIETQKVGGSTEKQSLNLCTSVL